MGSAASLVNDTEVIIIGAGVAGLNAARTLQAQGVPFVVVEAGHRIGGRAYSEQLANGSWFDLGCSYLHEGEINPLVAIANRFDVGLGDGHRFALDRWHFAAGDAVADAAQIAGFHRFSAATDTAMAQVDGDCALSDIMDWESPFAPTYAALMAGLNASDVTVQSVADYLRTGFGLDLPVTGGLGQLIARWGADVPVTLNCAVHRIEWQTGRVVVHTKKGRISARRAIITVSTGILADGQLGFAPDLPDSWTAAIAGLPCGTLNKIGLGFAAGSFAPEQAGWHVDIAASATEDGNVSGGFDINVDDKEQVIVFAGGSHGIYLERLGPNEMHDFAVAMVRDRFGSAIERQITSSITTAWHSEPLTLGSYAYATPGQALARDQLGTAIEDTLFFAGEATNLAHFGTCHGAYLSGANVANAIAVRATA